MIIVQLWRFPSLSVTDENRSSPSLNLFLNMELDFRSI